ncbi:MerR family transcriptional regulator [Actinoplanes sp. RD1]|uniref:MerR family transcriptional regulator n=1 Tax=Actinoplanes sp. RD1 TaxID=3064538 RepID=UPI002740BF9C|nr:MerR family transcriptional regulator [Actinoplanes sp. RD1]
MLTISQLAAHTGVTVRAVRHYHHIGLLPEPERDASGYRRYGATAVVLLTKIRTLADAGVPLSRIGRMLEADPEAFAEAIGQIDNQLRAEVDRLEASRKQIAQLTAGESLVLPPEVVAYLDRLRELGVSERIVAGERDGWILMMALRPEEVAGWMPSKFAALRDPRIIRLYRVLSTVIDDDLWDESLMVEAADIMAELNEEASAAGYDESGGDHDLLDSLADEADPRSHRMRDLMRERGWVSWTRVERL